MTRKRCGNSRVVRNRHLALLHCLEQCRLHFGWRPVDLVGEDEVGEDRSSLELEFALTGLGVVDVRAGDVRRQQIGVNWIRESWASRFLASLLMARVLARPGRPSTNKCPLASRPRIKRSIIPSWPMIDSDIRAFSWRTSSLVLIVTRSGESSCCAAPV
jgi:hypothetical protein